MVNEGEGVPHTERISVHDWPRGIESADREIGVPGGPSPKIACSHLRCRGVYNMQDASIWISDRVAGGPNYYRDRRPFGSTGRPPGRPHACGARARGKSKRI